MAGFAFRQSRPSYQVMNERRRRAHDSKASRRALMDAGTVLFAQNGFAGTTLDMIAAKAGANKALVAYHFTSKDGLYQAILDEAVEAVLARTAHAADPAGTPADRLRAHIRALALALAASPHLCAMLVTEYARGGQQDLPAACRASSAPRTRWCARGLDKARFAMSIPRSSTWPSPEHSSSSS